MVLAQSRGAALIRGAASNTGFTVVGNEGNVIMVAYGKCKCGLTPDDALAPSHQPVHLSHVFRCLCRFHRYCNLRIVMYFVTGVQLLPKLLAIMSWRKQRTSRGFQCMYTKRRSMGRN